MKIILWVVIVGLVVAGYTGRPYIDMLRDDQSLSCVVEQIELDLKSDGSVSDELTRQSHAAQCKAEAVFSSINQ
ncbi:MAG: hypothetical protein RL336_1025 [Pseudomonadota bacterium]|jgi:hypothetical protein